MDENLNTSKTEELDVSEHTTEWENLSKERNFKSSKRKLKKSVKIFITLLLILILLFLGAFGYYKFFKKDAEDIYRAFLKNTYTTMNEVINDETKEISDAEKVEGTISINSNIKDLKGLNGAVLSFLIETNEKDKTVTSNISYSEQDKEVLKGKAYFKDNKLYIDSKQIYSKPIMINDVPVYSFENKKQNEDMKYLLNKTDRYINQSLPKSLFKTEYGKIDLNGKKALVQKNIMYISKKDANQIKNKFLIKVKNDEKYINTLSTITKESSKDIKELIEESINKDISKEIKNITVEIDTNLITDKFIKLNVKAEKDPVINITKQKKDKYLFKGYEEGKLYIEGSLQKEDDENINLEAKAEDYTYNFELKDDSKIAIKVKNKNSEFVYINIKLDDTSKNIKKVSTKKAVDISKLTENEYNTIDNNIDKLLDSSKALSSLKSIK